MSLEEISCLLEISFYTLKSDNNGDMTMNEIKGFLVG